MVDIGSKKNTGTKRRAFRSECTESAEIGRLSVITESRRYEGVVMGW